MWVKNLSGPRLYENGYSRKLASFIYTCLLADFFLQKHRWINYQQLKTQNSCKPMRKRRDREWYNSCISYINPLVYINFWPYPYTFLAQRRNLWCKLKGGVVAYWYVSRLLDLPVLGLILGPGPLHRSFWGAADCTVNTVQIKKENTIGPGWLLKADQLTCSSNIKGSRKYGSDPDTWDRAWLIAASAFIPSVGQKRAPE